MGDGETYLYGGNTGSYVYFIDTAAGDGVPACSNTSRNTCALYRQANGVAQELVQGVEDLQIQYGWQANASDDLFFVDASTVAASAYMDNLNRIDRVRVTITLNAIDATAEGLIPTTVSHVFAVRSQI